MHWGANLGISSCVVPTLPFSSNKMMARLLLIWLLVLHCVPDTMPLRTRKFLWYWDYTGHLTVVRKQKPQSAIWSCTSSLVSCSHKCKLCRLAQLVLFNSMKAKHQFHKSKASRAKTSFSFVQYLCRRAVNKSKCQKYTWPRCPIKSKLKGISGPHKDQTYGRVLSVFQHLVPCIAFLLLPYTSPALSKRWQPGQSFGTPCTPHNVTLELEAEALNSFESQLQAMQLKRGDIMLAFGFPKQGSRLRNRSSGFSSGLLEFRHHLLIYSARDTVLRVYWVLSLTMLYTSCIFSKVCKGGERTHNSEWDLHHRQIMIQGAEDIAFPGEK